LAAAPAGVRQFGMETRVINGEAPFRAFREMPVASGEFSESSADPAALDEGRGRFLGEFLSAEEFGVASTDR